MLPTPPAAPSQFVVLDGWPCRPPLGQDVVGGEVHPQLEAGRLEEAKQGFKGRLALLAFVRADHALLDTGPVGQRLLDKAGGMGGLGGAVRRPGKYYRRRPRQCAKMSAMAQDRAGTGHAARPTVRRHPSAAPHVHGKWLLASFGPRTYVLASPEERPVETSTLGFPLSAADEFHLADAVSGLSASGDWESRLEQTVRSYQRDRVVAHAGHRWTGEPLGPCQVQYVPGDVCGLRASCVQGSLVTFDHLLHHPDDTTTNAERLAREVQLAQLLYEAVPYYLPVQAALGVAGSLPPTPDLIADLRLPFPHVAIFFGADLELPLSMVGGEGRILERARWFDDLRRAGETRFPANQAPPQRIGGAALQLARGNTVKVTGVVLSAAAGGMGLDDTILWLTVSTTGRGDLRRIGAASLSHATIRPVVANFAAAVAWGDWQPPPLDLELPNDPTSAAFRRAVRTGQFRRREVNGALAQVRVLDLGLLNRTARAHGDGTHASPATHIRRGHTRRQRVGPADDWHYQPIYIMPVVVNPTGQGVNVIKVYRLPDPTTSER